MKPAPEHYAEIEFFATNVREVNHAPLQEITEVIMTDRDNVRKHKHILSSKS